MLESVGGGGGGGWRGRSFLNTYDVVFANNFHFPPCPLYLGPRGQYVLVLTSNLTWRIFTLLILLTPKRAAQLLPSESYIVEVVPAKVSKQQQQQQQNLAFASDGKN